MPPGYVKKKLYRLNKTLYELKQVPRAGYNHTNSYFDNVGFHKCPYKHTHFIKLCDAKRILIVFYMQMT